MSGQNWLIRHQQLGGHVHVDIWCGTANQAEQQARPKVGSLIMDPEQWDAFYKAMSRVWLFAPPPDDSAVPIMAFVERVATGEVPVTDIHDGQDPDPIPDTTPKVGDILAFTREFEPFKAKDRVMVEAVEPDGTFQVAGVVRVVRRIDPQADGPVLEPVRTQEDNHE